VNPPTEKREREKMKENNEKAFRRNFSQQKKIGREFLEAFHAEIN
jgi:hypothetical protein